MGRQGEQWRKATLGTHLLAGLGFGAAGAAEVDGGEGPLGIGWGWTPEPGGIG